MKLIYLFVKLLLFVNQYKKIKKNILAISNAGVADVE